MKNAEYELTATAVIQNTRATTLQARPYNGIIGTVQRPECKLTNARADSMLHPRSIQIPLSEFNDKCLTLQKGTNVL